MPLYEYICEDDGTVVELMRPMSAADDPVEDPAGEGRRFVRKHSTFQAKSTRPLPVARPGCCPCGDPNGPCSN